MFKKSILIILVLMVSFGLIINAYSADIDGIDDGYEWADAVSYILINGESNCDVDYGAVKLFFDNENRAVYFCFMLKDPNLEADNLKAGVSFSVNDSDLFVLTAEYETQDYDFNKFSFEGAVSVDENHGASCEVRLGFKEGIPRDINCTVCFIDAKGMPSNEYDFSVVNEEYTERTVFLSDNTADNSNTVSKTTKANKTTESSSHRTETERSSRCRTTTERIGYTTEEFSINTSPLYVYSRTSVNRESSKTVLDTSSSASVTENKTTTERKTQTDKTQKKVATANVYYYEKEIIVYTDNITEITGNSSSSNTTFLSETNSEIGTTENSGTASVSVSEGKKYKTIIGVISAVLILLLAAWASKSGKGNKPSVDRQDI